MDAELSHTAENRPQLFVEDGTPIRFFVDPGSVLGRPKLIRTLKSAGAAIASDPKTSDFILVQSDANTGQHFVRDWRGDKTVLEATWVSKSISAGRLLKELDQWGGCLAVEDPSLPLEDLDQNHLPTPRITPVEQGPNARSFNPPIPLPHSYPPPPPHSPHPSQQPSGMNGPSFSNNVPPVPLQQPVHPNQLAQFPQQPGVQPPFYPYQAAPQQFPPGMSVDPQVFNMVLADLMQQRGLLAPWGGPPFGPGPGMQNGIHPGFFVPQGVNPMMNPMQNPSHPPGLIPLVHDHLASPPASAPLSPSLNHRSSVDLKGKGKATTSYGSHGPSGSAASSDKIFTSDSGLPLTFYVAIDVNKRSDILINIRKHGGHISTQTTADFAILSFRSKDFETLLETILSSNGTAVKPAFVFDSVERNTLLDSSQYEYEVPPKLLRKVQKSSPTRTDVEKKQAANLRKANARRARKEAAVKEERTSPGLPRPHIPSPSPPPAHTRVLWNGDKWRYPEVEDDYVRRYAAVLFDRDRQTSYATLSAKLHVKMPHHTDKGWNNHISQTLRDDIEDIRKRAIIAYRKEQHQQSQQSSADEPPVKRTKLSEDPDAGQQVVAEEVVAEEVEQDLTVVAHFFANGGDAEQPEGDEEQSVKDAHVWQKLTAKTACRTESSWEIFYNKHHTRILELYEMLIAAQESASTAE